MDPRVRRGARGLPQFAIVITASRPAPSSAPIYRPAIDPAAAYSHATSSTIFPMSTPPAPFAAADEFVLHDDLVYLNHATVAPWPRRTAEAVQRFAAENTTENTQKNPNRTKVEAALREQLRVLLNAPD